MFLMLHPNRPGPFRRTIVLEGGFSKLFVFQEKDPVDVPDASLLSIRSDIGVALVVPKLGGKADFEATEALKACEDSEQIELFLELLQAPPGDDEPAKEASAATKTNSAKKKPPRKPTKPTKPTAGKPDAAAETAVEANADPSSASE